MEHRNQKILDAAEGEACTLLSPLCNGDKRTVVACHSNEQVHGKGRGIKAHDIFVFFGCANCHSWFDDSSAPREQKREYFHYAHAH